MTTYTPWIVKRKADGSWVVQQANRVTGRISQYGPFTTEAEARELLQLLTGREARLTTTAK